MPSPTWPAATRALWAPFCTEFQASAPRCSSAPVPFSMSCRPSEARCSTPCQASMATSATASAPASAACSTLPAMPATSSAPALSVSHVAWAAFSAPWTTVLTPPLTAA